MCVYVCVRARTVRRYMSATCVCVCVSREGGGTVEESSEIQAVLQCFAVCCSVLQCVAVCCSVLQCDAECCSMLQCIIVCCSML